MRDWREPARIRYPAAFLITTGLVLFLVKLGARRQLRFACATPAMVGNLNQLASTQVAQVEHPDTLEYFLARLPVGELAHLGRRMLRRLLRMKCLDRFRYAGTWLVAIDGTGLGSWRRPHCPQCLRYKQGEGTLYTHLVVDATLVTANGLALSLLTEFVENAEPVACKQDCELRAFYRLAERLKQAYPHLPLCLLLDGLYLCEPVLRVCRQQGWRYVITFKPGRLPERWGEYKALRALAPEQRLVVSTPQGSRQAYAWVQGLEIGQECTHILECEETTPAGTVLRFVWATSDALSPTTVVEVATQGRLRWKIENQGFNEQKNGGYNLEHAYSQDPQAAKNYYLLLQMGQVIEQLMQKGFLLRRVLGGSVRHSLGGVRKLGECLKESLRVWMIPAAVWDVAGGGRIQIRFDTS